MGKAQSVRVPDERAWSLLGTNVRTLRKSLGWTLAALAGRAGVSLATLKRVEAGVPCSLRTQQRLATGLPSTLGSLWEPRLFDAGRVSAFRP